MKNLYEKVVSFLDGKKTYIGIVAWVCYKLAVANNIVTYDPKVEVAILGWIGVGVRSAL